MHNPTSQHSLHFGRICLPVHIRHLQGDNVPYPFPGHFCFAISPEPRDNPAQLAGQGGLFALCRCSDTEKGGTCLSLYDLHDSQDLEPWASFLLPAGCQVSVQQKHKVALRPMHPGTLGFS